MRVTVSSIKKMGMSVTALMDIMATIARLVMALQPSLVENNFDYHMKVIYFIVIGIKS